MGMLISLRTGLIRHKKERKTMAKHYHPYHLVEPSPYPYMASFAALGVTTGAVMYFHSYEFGGSFLFLSLVLLTIIAYNWWRDIVREATFQGHHTLVVQRGLRYGMLLFIVSEATCRTSNSNIKPVFFTFECFIRFMKLRPV